jgi:hypothetical protein
MFLDHHALNSIAKEKNHVINNVQPIKNWKLAQETGLYTFAFLKKNYN